MSPRSRPKFDARHGGIAPRTGDAVFIDRISDHDLADTSLQGALDTNLTDRAGRLPGGVESEEVEIREHGRRHKHQ